MRLNIRYHRKNTEKYVFKEKNKEIFLPFYTAEKHEEISHKKTVFESFLRKTNGHIFCHYTGKDVYIDAYSTVLLSFKKTIHL